MAGKWVYDGTEWQPTNPGQTPPTVQNFSTSQTAVAPAGYKWVLAEAIGGGGQYGYSTVDAQNQCGGGGGYANGFFTAAQFGTSQTVTIGAGATGSGASGGNTSVGTLVTAVGGVGAGASNLNQAPGSPFGTIGGNGTKSAAGAAANHAATNDCLAGGAGGTSSTPNGVAPGGGAASGGTAAPGAVRLTFFF